MAQEKNYVFRDEEETSSRLSRKAKESPFMLVGIGGLVLACGFAAYKFKHRGEMSTSVFLMQTRVAAQGTVVSCLTLGLLYSMFQKHVLHKDD
ncbi:HIG1 domain family member 1C-like [Chironomus tepperi]|uniref:HIG1 domain family member 1C-like n=1 Tax=Chironomus tepperi TaxID=113505 RepID=UPI00391F5376